MAGHDKSGVSCKCLGDKKKKKEGDMGLLWARVTCLHSGLRADVTCHRILFCHSQGLSSLSLCKLQSMAALKSEGEKKKKKAKKEENGIIIPVESSWHHVVVNELPFPPKVH